MEGSLRRWRDSLGQRKTVAKSFKCGQEGHLKTFVRVRMSKGRSKYAILVERKGRRLCGPSDLVCHWCRYTGQVCLLRKRGVKAKGAEEENKVIPKEKKDVKIGQSPKEVNAANAPFMPVEQRREINNLI
jgi:hypothetical protein